MTEDELEVGDPADRLHRLCKSIVSASTEVRIDNNTGHAAPLWQSFEPIAQHLEMDSYAALRDNFLLLSDRVMGGVRRLELRKSSVRAHWEAAVVEIASVFDAKNFGGASGKIFNRCFNVANMATLEAISERFQAHGWSEKPKHSLEEAFVAIKGAVDEMEAATTFPAEMIRVLRHLLAQMQGAIATYETFGEEGFWRAYKETFATFVQLHQWIDGAENKTTIREKITVVGGYLAGALSITANAATVAGFGLPLFLPPVKP